MRIRAASDLGAIARERRRELEISQHELARRAGVTRQWLVRFERGNTEVALAKVFAVLRELNLTLRADNSGSPQARQTAVGYVIPRVELPQGVPARQGEARLSEMREKIASLDGSSSSRNSGDRG